MATSYDPNAPLIDPDIQAALAQGRQAQLAALLGQQQASAVPRTLGEGIGSLGPALLKGIALYQAKNAATANNASMAAALGGAQPPPFLGGPSTMTPMSAAPAAGPPLASAASAGPSLVDSSYDPKGIGAGLQPQFADRLQDTLQDVADQGINAKVTSGLRTPEQQTALYAQGRTAPGPIVTNAGPGSSYHNFGAAADVTPEGGGTPAQFAAIGDAAKNLGLKWGGDFRSINDQDHLQMPGSLADARAAQGGAAPASSSGVLAGIRAGETGNQPGYPVGDGGSSFGPYQMHMGGLASGGNSGPGLGDDFKRDTGLDPRNPSTLPAQEAWINNWAAGKSSAQIKQAFHGYIPEVAANGPASYGVPAGQVAGPGVPSTLQPTTPAGRAAALGVPTPPAEEEEEAPTTPPPVQPPPGPSMLSPTPMGAPQGFVPPVAAPQVAAQAVPPTVPAALPPAAPPPSAVAGGSGAPPGTHWAHLPGPPLLLAGDEGGGQAPQQAPQQGGGSSGLLAQLFGGGQAQAAPIRAPAPMAAGLAQQGPQTAPAPSGLAGGLAGGQGAASSPPAPSGLAGGLAGQQPAPPQQAPVSGNQAVYQQMYQAAAGPAARLQHAAAIAAASGNQALAQEYERQAAPFVAEINKANDLAVAERTEKPQLFTRNDGSSYLGDPRTGQPVANISPAKPAERQVTPDEASKLGLPNSSYMINPQTGAVTQIGGTAEKDDTSQIKNYNFYVNQLKARSPDATPVPFEQYDNLSAADKEKVLAPGSEVVKGGKVVIKNEPTAGLSPEAIDELATRAIGGDNSGMVGLGRGAQGAQNLVAVQNRVAQIAQDKGIDPAGIQDNIAEFYGQKAGARTVGNIGAKLEVFGNSAANALDMAAQRSSELPRSQWVPVNKVVQAAQQAGSDPRLAVLNAATETAVNEYTRAVGGTGASTDTAKQHAYDMLNAAQSPEAFNSVVNGLKWEVQNLHNAAKGVAGGLRKGTGGSAEPPPLAIPPGPGAAPTTPMTAPQAPVTNVAPNVTGAPPATRRGTYVPGKGIVFQ